MKKLINRPERVVDEMVEGLLAIYPEQARVEGFKVLIRRDACDYSDSKVALISGGGSGHEPAHAGYVGSGMLTAAVAGEVFTSPSANSVLAAIEAVGGRAGTLLIVKNYTGDRLNFGFAAEMARSRGYPIASVVVADDVALLDQYDRSDARGIAGTVLVHKIAGAAADDGKSLAEVLAIAEAAAEDIGSMGLSLSAGTSPVTGVQSFTLADNEVELGLGIHGEPGVRRLELEDVDVMTERLIGPIIRARGLSEGERLVVLVNNLGATTPMELALVARAAWLRLRARGFVVERLYAGTFLSSLEMAGVSLSIMRVDDERLRWLDAPTRAPAWPGGPLQLSLPLDARTIPAASAAEKIANMQPAGVYSAMLRTAIDGACQSLIDAEDHLTALDREVGDADLGNNLTRAARVIRAKMDALPVGSATRTLHDLGLALQDILGGSSGPLYGVLFLRTAAELEMIEVKEPASWAAAILSGCAALSQVGGAERGDCTMLDALIPFAEALDSATAQGFTLAEALTRAVEAAEQGARETAGMKPRKGRSRYLGGRAIGHADPGAAAVAIWLRAASLSLLRPFENR